MPITVLCPCQNEYRVKDELAGKRIKCPHCKQPVDVPMYDQPVPAAQSDPYDQYSQDSHGTAYAAGAAFGHQNPDDEYQLQPTGIENENPYQPPAQHDGYGPAPTKSHSSGVNGGAIMAGVGMMVGAVIWFVVGMAAGRIFFYPPILFIFGLVSFVKGLIGSE